MEVMLTKEKHKAMVEFLWLKSRASEQVLDKLADIGFVSIEGQIARATEWAFDVLEFILPSEVINNDEFYDEFHYGENFEEFYRKWFEVDKG